jgi:Ser/Thr protein kinase RdoA (MazF antagonist)
MDNYQPDKETLNQLAHTALKQWNIEVASVAFHVQRENTVFRVVAVDGEEFALRVHRHGYHDRAELESEHEWTTALLAAGLSVPRHILTRTNQPYATVSIPNSDQSRHAGLVKWIPGNTLANHLEETPGLSEVSFVYERLGQVIADFHLATVRWTPSPDFKRHALDAEGFVGETPFWGRFWEIEAASDDHRTKLSTIRTQLLDILSGLPQDESVYGMIHADLNADNVLRDGEKLSVIDFDDAGFGWHAFDLAVAIWDRMDAITGQTYFGAAYDALLKGYQRRRSDCGHIIEHVPLFLLIRSLMLLRWMQDRPEAGYTPLIPSLLELALVQANRLSL